MTSRKRLNSIGAGRYGCGDGKTLEEQLKQLFYDLNVGIATREWTRAF